MKGFTLIELMVTLALVVIVATIAVPSYRSLVQNNRATTEANELLSAFQLARSEAVKRGVPVAVCASANTGTTDPTCAGSNQANWATGWIVFVDDGATPGLRDTGANPEELLRVFNAIEGDDDLLNTKFGLNATASGGSPGYVAFGGNGFLLQNSNGATDFHLELPDCDGQQARRITINVAGRPRVERVTCNN